MVLRVLARLRAAATIGRIVVAAAEPVRAALPPGAADEVVPGDGSFVENLLALARAVGPDRPLLACTGDMALVTPAAVDDLVTRSQASGADVCYCAIPRADNDRMFPVGKRTFVRLREGEFTGGNATYLGPGFVQGHEEIIQRLFQYRKRPLQLARLLGLGFVLRLLLGRLSLAAVERRAGRILGCRVAVIISHYPEIGFDVDQWEDLQTLRFVLADQSSVPD
jgi:hypothetical protein